MDPKIMRLLEEDEDDTTHLEADLDALTAELRRDIESNTSMLFDSNAVLPQGSRHTTTQFLPQWLTSGGHDGIGNFQSLEDIVAAVMEKDQHSSELKLRRRDSCEPNPLLPNPSIVSGPQQQDVRNTFHSPQPVGGRPSPEEFVDAKVVDHKAEPDKELQMNKLQNIAHHSLMVVGSNDQHPILIESDDQDILPTGKGGIGNNEVIPPLDQHPAGMSRTSQQAITSGRSSQQHVTMSKSNGKNLIGMFVSRIKPHLGKDRTMKFNILLDKLKKKEISSIDFFGFARNIVGDELVRMALGKVQTQTAGKSETVPNQSQSQPHAFERKTQVPSVQLPTDLSNSHGAQIAQMSTSISGAISHERKHSAFSAPGLNKQQHMQFSQTSFPTYGSARSGYPPFLTTSAASPAEQSQPHESQTRQVPSQPNHAVNHLVPTSRPMKVANMPTFDRPHSLTDPKKIPDGSLAHMNRNTMLQQNQVQRPSSTIEEQKTASSPSIIHLNQEPSDQCNDQQRSHLSASHGYFSPSALNKLGSAASGSLKNGSFELQTSQAGPTPPTLLPSRLVSSPSCNTTETNIVSSSPMLSRTAPVRPGNNSKAPRKKPLRRKKPMEAPGTQPPSSKKKKMSVSFADQSIEHLNDVTAVSGVNLREEEEQLFSGSKEDIPVSEAYQRVVQEEEERLILQNIPLKKIMVEIMAKCGIKNMSKEVARCLSLCTEERMFGLIYNIIRLSKQRVDMEKPRHKIVITSDVRQQIMNINRIAREEWDKKQAETGKSQKLNEPESSTGDAADKEKGESRRKSMKVNKEEDDKIRATAANVAVRAATGVGDITLRWQLMIDTKQKQGRSDISSDPQTNKDVGQNPCTRNTREDQESENRDHPVALTTPVVVHAAASIRKVGRNKVVVPRVARTISVKDVIAVLEREPQMSKSTLLYRLYQKVSVDKI